MKKTSSLVWRFFDRLEENNRCVAVLCKLCDTQYKYFGNTTNLRTHLVNKHPIQWDLLQNGTLDESKLRSYNDDDSTNQTSASISARQNKRRYVKNYKNENVDLLENSDIETDHNTDDLLVRQMHNNRNSDEEWLEDEVYQSVDTFEPKRKKMKVRHIKREVQSPPPPPRRSSSYFVPAKPKASESIYVDNSPRKDEYTVFGEYVANKLRKFKGAQTRGNIQQLITTILWQAEYGIYDNMESVKRIILHSVKNMDMQQTQEAESHVTGTNVQENQVQMLIEHRGEDQITAEQIRIIDTPSSE